MLNLHLSYKPLSSWRILFRSGVCPRLVSCIKIYSALVVLNRGFRKGITLQGIMTPMGVLPNGQLCLKIKGGVMGSYVYSPRHRNIIYVKMVRRSIYKTIRPKHPQPPIHRYKQHSQGPASWICYTLPN